MKSKSKRKHTLGRPHRLCRLYIRRYRAHVLALLGATWVFFGMGFIRFDTNLIHTLQTELQAERSQLDAVRVSLERSQSALVERNLALQRDLNRTLTQLSELNATFRIQVRACAIEMSPRPYMP